MQILCDLNDQTGADAAQHCLLYHGSVTAGLTELEPRSLLHGTDTPVVYLTASPAYALFYIWDEAKGRKHVTCWLKDGTVYYEEQFPGQLAAFYQGVSGCLYALGRDCGFKPMEERESMWYSTAPVSVGNCLEIPDVYTAIQEQIAQGKVVVVQMPEARRVELRERLITEILEKELLFDEESPDGRLYVRYFPEAWSAAQERLLETLLERFGLSGAKVVPFLREEDGTAYAVWRVETPDRTLVLKRAKAEELAIYQRFLQGYDFAPGFYGAVREGNSDYVLMEHVVGTDLCKCDRPRLQAALDALIASQRPWWDSSDDYGYAAALQRRISRGNYLKDAALEAAYARFLTLFQRTPRTLCHDDLLPFNVLVGERAVLIDWETAAMLPYPTPLARLIAHGTEDPEALFYMSAADRDFAIDYYYEQFIREQGIPYAEYRRTLDYFLLFEYCEWIMLGNKYPDADMERFAQYSRLAKVLVQRLA